MVVVGCAAWGAALGWNTRAEACSPPPPEWVHVPSEVPQGGLIVGRLSCPACTTADLVFRSGDAAVTGTFVEVTAFDDERFFAFEPSAPLPVTDAADATSGLFVGFASGEAVERRVIITAADAAEPTATGSLSGPAEFTRTHACAEYTSSVYGLCSAPTYASETTTRAAIELAVEHGSQYFYRAAYSVPGDANGEVGRFGLAADVSSYQFPGTPAEACYSLMRVALDGTEVALIDECLSTDALDFTPVEELRGDVDGTLMFCRVPPAGEEQRWCDHFAEAIAAESCEGFTTDSCEAALAACDADGGYVAGAGGGTEGGFAEGDHDDDTTSEGNDESSGGGCSTGRGASSGGWAAVLALFAVGGLVRRRAYVTVRD